MQIIVISDRLAKAKTLTLTTRHLFASALAGGVMLAGLTICLYVLTFRLAGDVKIPFLQQIVLAAQQGETQKASEFVQQNLNAMAVKLGEMQAQLTRLDAVGERLSSVAGIKPQEFRLNEPPGLGGAQSATFPSQNLSMQEFTGKLETLSRQMENRTDLLGVLEAQMFEQAVKKKLLPTILPVSGTYNASSFGVDRSTRNSWPTTAERPVTARSRRRRSGTPVRPPREWRAAAPPAVGRRRRRGSGPARAWRG